MGIEVPSDDDWRREGLEEVQIQSRNRGRSVEVDHGEATSIEPETNGEDLEVGSRWGGDVLLLHGIGAKGQRRE